MAPVALSPHLIIAALAPDWWSSFPLFILSEARCESREARPLCVEVDFSLPISHRISDPPVNAVLRDIFLNLRASSTSLLAYQCLPYSETLNDPDYQGRPPHRLRGPPTRISRSHHLLA